jgi:hypothetical protein
MEMTAAQLLLLPTLAIAVSSERPPLGWSAI